MNEQPSEKPRIKIEKKGSFFQTDKEGFIINPTSPEKIQDKWKPVLDDIVAWHKEAFGGSLKNVYVRGSVAKGDATENVSDVDTFAYVDLTEEEIDAKAEAIKTERIELDKKYPFVHGVEIIIMSLEKSNKKSEIVLLNQSLCIYGDPVDHPRLKPGKDLILHAPNIDKRIKSIGGFMKEDHSDERIKSKCVWIMKRLLRVGCEIVIERSGKYTRDLYPCYEVFSEYYPEKESEMREALELALNPTANKEKIQKIMHNMGEFLQKETSKYLL